eukprot:jgi/Bigna1/81785/fgenesh1_pg.84_\
MGLGRSPLSSVATILFYLADAAALKDGAGDDGLEEKETCTLSGSRELGSSSSCSSSSRENGGNPIDPVLSQENTGQHIRFKESMHLIFKGLATHWPAKRWSYADLIGKYMKEKEYQSLHWKKRRYGFDYGIVDQCPILTRDFKIPKYFSQCLLQTLSRKDAARNPKNVRYFWPTMMIGSPQTRSEIHYDDDGLPFWMGLVRGKKLFRILTPSLNAHLVNPEARSWPSILDQDSSQPG